MAARKIEGSGAKCRRDQKRDNRRLLHNLDLESARLFDASLALSSCSVYEQAEQSFKTILQAYNLAFIWPPSLENLVRFIAYLSKKNYSPSMVRSYISGISYKLKVGSYHDNTQSFLIKKILTGYERLNSRSDVRELITLTMMQQMPNALMHVCSSKYEHVMFSAAFLLVFAAFLRVGEITVKSNRDVNYVLSNKDIIIDQSTSTIFVTIPFSKTDQIGVTSTLAVKQIEGLDLISTMTVYLNMRPTIQGPLFCHLNGKFLTRYQFHSILSTALRFLNYDVKKFNTHLFRIGAATFAFMNGKTENEIKTMGRWNSATYK